MTWTTPPQGTPAWTPPPRPGIVPLHPLSFGTVLGRSFAALRQNPRVLLGFALVVQIVGYLVVGAVVGALAFALFSRLDTVAPGSKDFDAIMAGSVAITIVVAVVLGLAAGVLGVIVQAVVVTEVAHEVIAEKLTLRALWQQVRPVAWRLIGYAAILLAAVVAGFAAAAVIITVFALLTPIAAVLAAIPLIAGTVVLALWLSTKLLLVPAAIILERATIRGGIARSWRLTRTRFWPILGVTIVIQLIFQALAQAVAIPLNLLGTSLSTIISPTGSTDTAFPIGFVVTLLAVQALSLLISAISTVVLSTTSALLYVDCRMRHEGLDLDLLSYVEQRDAGVQGLPDPYTVGIGRVVAPRLAPMPPVGYPVPGYAVPGYAVPGYPGGPAVPPAPYQGAPGAPVVSQPASPYAAAPAAPLVSPGAAGDPAAAPTAAGAPVAPAAPSTAAPVAPAAPPAPAPAPAPAPTQWTAPGQQPDDPPAAP